MAEKRKPGKSSGADGGKSGGKSGGKKQKPGVKLDPRFHKRLKTVADDIGLDMGVLIEREMEDFVNREVKRIAGDLLADSPPD